MLNVLGMIVDRYDGVLPWRMPARAPARNRSVRSSRRSCERTSSSWRERPRVERDAHLRRDGLVRASGPSPLPAAGHERRRVAGPRQHTVREVEPVPGLAGPHEPQGGEPEARLGGRGGLELGGGQDVRERVEVVADADAALGGGLHRGRAAAGERVEDDVAGPAVAGDERVGERRREAREVRAHRVQAVAPQPLLVLPLGLEPEGRERARELEGELAGVLADGRFGHVPRLDGSRESWAPRAKGRGA